MLWHLKYALWQKDMGDVTKLRPDQVTNYFSRNNVITTKSRCAMGAGHTLLRPVHCPAVCLKGRSACFALRISVLCAGYPS